MLDTGRINGRAWVAGGAACLTVGLAIRALWKARTAPRKLYVQSPKDLVLPKLSEQERSAVPYLPDALPGTRSVQTPYGSIQVFEWGPADGERVLLLHGIGTPCLALGDLAEELVRNGYRVMLFDFFGRGFSDAPTDIPYDMRLYTTQILLVLASSSLPWTGDNGFHLVGYSLGGGIAASFSRYFPHMVRSLVCVAGGGLIRKRHVSRKSKLLYSTGLLPEWLLESLVKSRLKPKETVTEQTMVAEVTDLDTEDPKVERLGGNDSTGGQSFDHAAISERWPGVTVSKVMTWQLQHHEGFVPAFMNTIRHAPIYEETEEWEALGVQLRQRRNKSREDDVPPGLIGGKVMLILGSLDPVILKDEIVPDTKAALGEDAVEIFEIKAGHELAIAKGAETAQAAMAYWGRVKGA